MEQSLYKDLKVSRGLTYHYYFSPTTGTKPTIVFLHGFPSTSHDYRHQASFFRAKGYGVLVPDLLGYGGTAKPDDPAAYVQSLIVRDIVDILDAEGVQKFVSIGHDWGTMTNSRLGNYFPDRVIALGFLNIGYSPPLFAANFDALSAATKAAVGYETFGYWRFFNEDDADKLIESHLDSFFSAGFSSDPTVRRTEFAPVGALKAWLEADKRAPPCTYLSDEVCIDVLWRCPSKANAFSTLQERAIQKEFFIKGGFKGPLNWYKVVMRGFANADDQLVPKANYAISQPVFFWGCKLDYVCRPELAKPALNAYAKDLTYREFDGDHWTLLSHPDDVNRELLAWMEKLPAQSN
ncbi:hypothetical protein HWV62_27081 [Athelia sp. TMB]|nr:hypothetical protein HWV62_27081 [Athelia sp. TMB]